MQLQDTLACIGVVMLGIMLLVARRYGGYRCPTCGSDPQQPCRACWRDRQW